MPRETIATQILSSLAEERRVIVADWRFHIHYLRLARAQGYRLPDFGAAKSQIGKLIGRGEFAEIPGIHGVYRVVVPYASSYPAPAEAVVQEANPTAVFSHFTAIAHHGLTDEVPDSIYAVHAPKVSQRLPLGTSADDWIDLYDPPRRRPEHVGERSVVWSQTKSEWDFGHKVGYIEGTAVYVTDLERTLFDALRSPEKCGGISAVFRVWRHAYDDVNIDRLLEYTDRVGQRLMQQRIGYVLEQQLGQKDARFDKWASQAQRGSSAKLVATEPFSSSHSERWCLSINVSDAQLSELHD